MNIGFFIPNIDKKGGVERATIALVNALATQYKIYLIVCNYNNNSFPIDQNVIIINLGIDNYKKQYLLLFKRLRGVIKEYNITHFISIETMSLLFTFIPLFTLKNRPKFIVWEHFNFYNNNGRKLRDFFRKLAAKYADLIVTLTERDVNTWKENLNIKNKITYIYNISPFEEENPSYKEDSKKVISVGRYVEVKGFDRLIQAWSILEKKYDINGWKLSIIGYGEQRVNLQKLIDSLGCKSIQLIDGNSDIRYIYKEASIYCMSSYSEGLGMVLIEAQSFGLPSISFDIYAGPSEILSCGSGILVKDGDLEAYAKAIFDLINFKEQRSRMSSLAIENKHRFDSEMIAKEWSYQLENL